MLESSELSAHDGAGIFANHSAKVFIVGCTLRTKSVKGGGISAQSQAEVTISDSLFDGCTSFSHAGGAIYASPEPNQGDPASGPFKPGTGGVKLDISNTTFKDSQGTASPPEEGGKALYLAECAQVKMVNTVFEPFDAKTVVTITPADQLLVLAGSGCTVYPCSPGQACSYSRLSLQCTPCPSGTFGDGTGTCQACTPGKQPNQALTACEECETGQYSQFGNPCQACSRGQFVNTGKTACTACRAGEGPQDGKCVKCSAGKYSTFGECQECHPPNVVGADNTSCTACAPGKEPDTQRLTCIECLGAKFSTSGAKCEDCNHPNVVNIDGDAPRSTCSACQAGTGPNADHTGCEKCSVGANFSKFGVCLDCPSPNVVSEDRTQCSPCDAGTGPNPSHTGCDKCTETGYYSSNGECTVCPTTKYVPSDRKTCAECPAGQQPNAEQTQCQRCQTGHYAHQGGACQECQPPNVVSSDGTECTRCPDGQGIVNWHCTNCTDRTYSVSGQCQDCPDPRVVDASHTTCNPCHPGKAPAATGVGCVACVGANYSKFGDRCQQCESTMRVDEYHTACVSCEPGKQASADQTECVLCEPGKYSSLGVQCEHCQPPNVVSADNTSCVACRAGYGSVDGQCALCKGANYSTLGQCQECQLPNIVDETHTRCVKCSPGEEPNVERSGCRACNGSFYSTDGSKCLQCARPMVINIKRTACTVCKPGRGPDGGFTNCTDCQPGETSTYGEPCRTCEKGKTANPERTSCVPPFACPPGWECKYGLGKCTDNSTCTRCLAGYVSTSESQCTQCIRDAGVRANPKHTECERCEAGTEPSKDLNSCVPCLGSNFSRNGYTCEVCSAPRIVSVVSTHERPAHSDCTACPAGRGPNDDHTDCVDCTGNDASPSGVCTACKTGYIANDKRTACTGCGERKAYVPGYSDRTGVCGCGPGFYDARLSLIVCLQNGFNSGERDDTFEELCNSEDLKPDMTKTGKNGTIAESPICLQCPTCATCESGVPELRDGYVLGSGMGVIHGQSCGEATVAARKSNLKLPPQDRSVYHAFLCDADTAVTPTDISKNGYFTNDAADSRCNHNCTSGRCNVTMPGRSVQTAEILNRKQQLQDTSRCSFGYAGEFCQSCDHGFFQVRKGHVSTCEPCADEKTACVVKCLNLCYLSMLVGLFALPMLYGFVKCCAGCCTKRDPSEQQTFNNRTTLILLEQQNTRRVVCCSMEFVRVLKAATFPAIKILITYAQVTGQLSHVLHVQYPPKFSRGVDFVKPLLDFWSVFFRPDCNGLGSFGSRWWMRVVGQPMLFLAVVELIYYITWLGGYANQSDAKKARTQNRLRAGFLCYPTMCNLCFSTLNCIQDTVSTDVLVDDDRQKCPEPGNWFGLEGLVLVRMLYVGILIFVGLGAPLVYSWRVFRASRNGAYELQMLKPLRDLAAEELWDDPELLRTDNALIGILVQNRWRQTLRYQLRKSCCHKSCRERKSCCCLSTDPEEIPVRFDSDHRDKLARKLTLRYREEQKLDDVTAAFIESTKLQTFSSLTEAYKPGHYYCYWEAIDMLRKFFLAPTPLNASLWLVIHLRVMLTKTCVVRSR